MYILGVRIDELTLLQAKEKVLSLIEQGEKQYVCTPNSEIIYHAHKNSWFKEVLNKAVLNVADGIGVVYASRILKNPLPERVPGYDLCLEILSEFPKNGFSVYLLGSKPGIAEAAARVLEEKYPGLKIAGTRDGYFKDDREVIENINKAGTDLLLVCTGFPKQEKWMHDNLDKLDIKVAMGLGGTLDGISGKTKRSPDFYIKHNLEWFHRLLQDPKRFVRMLALPAFIITVAYHKLFFKKV